MTPMPDDCWDTDWAKDQRASAAEYQRKIAINKGWSDVKVRRFKKVYGAKDRVVEDTLIPKAAPVLPCPR